jgi:hypothetical protein
MPYGTPRVDVTTNHDRVRAAAGLVAGTSQAVLESAMTYGEAAAIETRDTKALLAYWERSAGARASVGFPEAPGCEPPGEAPDPAARTGRVRRLFDEPAEVPVECVRVAGRALERHRRHTRDILDVLRAIAERMTNLEGQKAIVFVSEGMLHDLDTLGDVRRFAEAAERARVALYALHLDAPLVEAGTGSNSTQSRLLDDYAGFDAMAEVAAAARGSALRVVGPATNALARIDAELAGYYLLSFEREPADRDGARVRIDVTVNRPGLDVRARREFTPLAAAAAPAAPSPPADLRAAMGALLQWPVAATDLGLDVDTFVVPVTGAPEEARVIVTAEISGVESPLAAVGYEMVDAATGKGVADAFDAPPATREIGAGRQAYLVAVPMSAGRYRLKLGVLDVNGRRGSVEHAFDVPGWPADRLRVGELVLGAETGGAFRPLASVTPDMAEVVARVEVLADVEVSLDRLSARAILEPSGGGISLDPPAVSIAEAQGDPLRRVAVARWNPRDHAPGTYVVTIVVESSGREIARRSRAFTRR